MEVVWCIFLKMSIIFQCIFCQLLY